MRRLLERLMYIAVYSDTRRSEMVLLLAMAWWVIQLLWLTPSLFAAPSYKTLLAIAPQVDWGLFMLAVVLIMAVGLGARIFQPSMSGRRKDVFTWCSIVGTTLAIFVWASITSTFAFSGATPTGIGVYTIFTFTSVSILIRHVLRLPPEPREDAVVRLSRKRAAVVEAKAANAPPEGTGTGTP